MDQPPLKFRPGLARRQVDFQYPRIRRKAQLAPIRREIHRNISFPTGGTPARDYFCDRLNQQFPGLCKQWGQKNSQMVFMRLQNEASPGCFWWKQVQREPETCRSFGRQELRSPKPPFFTNAFVVPPIQRQYQPVFWVRADPARGTSDRARKVCGLIVALGATGGSVYPEMI
jgi:hypothetical protein